MNERIHELIIKELQGKATEHDQAELRAWLAQDEANKQFYDKLKQGWQASETYRTNVKVDVEAAWKKVSAAVGEEKEVKLVPMYRRVLAVAASVAVIIGLGWLAMQNTGVAEAQYATVTTGAESKNIHLADGTDVWLNANSSFTYPQKFGDTRHVKLSGEAFFEVAKDAAHPFIISAGVTNTQVLGTSFNVRAYSAEGNVEVSVATGKVAFGDSAGQQKVFLLPGDMGAYNVTSQNLSKAKTGNNYLAWKTGELQFDHLPVADVVMDLERYYHISMVLRDSSLTQVTFSGKLSRQPLGDAVKILESSLGVRINRDDANTYSIYSN